MSNPVAGRNPRLLGPPTRLSAGTGGRRDWNANQFNATTNVILLYKIC